MLTSTEYVQYAKPFDVLLGALDRFMALEPGWSLKDPDEFMRLSLSEDKSNWFEYYERDIGELLEILIVEFRKIKEFESLEVLLNEDNCEQNISTVFEFIDDKRQVNKERISTDLFEM